MFSQYFQEELTQLRELGKEFGQAHPSLAPMLSGVQADPDVERLLEGTAFLTATLRRKLDDEFPEIIHDLLQIVAPHYLQPTPAATIQVFQPKSTVRNSFVIPAGTSSTSVPVDGTACHFRTCYDTEIHPLKIVDAKWVQPPGRPAAIHLVFDLKGLSLAQWKPSTVRLYLADEFARATELYRVLRRHVSTITAVPMVGGRAAVFERGSLRPVGFGAREHLVPYPAQAFPGFGLLRDYFALPQKFLFLDLVGWEQWRERGTGQRFEIHLEVDDTRLTPLKISADSVMLHATPAVNLFAHEGDPITLDHRSVEYPIRPSGLDAEHYQLFSVDEVKGFAQGTCEERTYTPFEAFRAQTPREPVYHLRRSASIVHAGIDHSISVAYPDRDLPSRETLSIRLTCTNGSLPTRLKAGDITVHGKGCPEYVTFTNLLPPRAGASPRLDRHLLWKLLSHLSMSFQSLEQPGRLKSLLELYVSSEVHELSALAHRKRIEGVVGVHAEPEDRLLSGMAMRGRHVTVEIREDHFAGRGDAFLFGGVLEMFFGYYASINSFTRLTLNDTHGRSHDSWPPRTGSRTLI